jgi:hypothetical protein
MMTFPELPLAPFGAKPAFAEPLHVGRPNIGDRARRMERIDDILDRRWLTHDGPYVRAFERCIREYVGVRDCVVTCNGTTALEILIRAIGEGLGARRIAKASNAESVSNPRTGEPWSFGQIQGILRTVDRRADALAGGG